VRGEDGNGSGNRVEEGRLMGVRGLISVAEAAERLGVSSSHAYNLVATERLRSVKVGTHILVRESSVASFKPRPVGRPRKKGKKRPSAGRRKKGGER